MWRAVGSGSPPPTPQVTGPPTMQPGSPCRRGGGNSAGINLASPASSPARGVGVNNGVVEQHPPETTMPARSTIGQEELAEISHKNLKLVLAPPKSIFKEGGGGEDGDTPAAPHTAREKARLPGEGQITPLKIPEKMKKVPTQVVIKGRKYSFRNSTISSYLNKSTTTTMKGTTTNTKNTTPVPGRGEVDVVHGVPVGNDGLQGGGDLQGHKGKGVVKEELRSERDHRVPGGGGGGGVPGDDGVHEGGDVRGPTGEGVVKDEVCSGGDHGVPGGGDTTYVQVQGAADHCLGPAGDTTHVQVGGGGVQGQTRKVVVKDEVSSEGGHTVPGEGEVDVVHGVPGDDGVQGGGGVQVHTKKGVVKGQHNSDSDSDMGSEINPSKRVKVPRPSPNPSQKIDLHKVRDSTPSLKKVTKKPIKGLKKRKNRLTKVQLLEEQAKKCTKMTQYLTRPGVSSSPSQLDKNKIKCQQQAAESRLELTLKPNPKQNMKPIIPVQKSDSSKQNMNSHGENNKSNFEDLGKAAC